MRSVYVDGPYHQRLWDRVLFFEGKNKTTPPTFCMLPKSNAPTFVFTSIPFTKGMMKLRLANGSVRPILGVVYTGG